MIPPNTRFLVVDDMATIRDMVKTNLRTMGQKNIWEADDGAKAVEVLKQMLRENQPINFVISDWNMPNMKGIELLKKVRNMPEYFEIPFVLLTTESEKPRVTEAIIAGVSQYIVKPFSLKIFEEKLNSAWAKHQKTS